MAAALPRPRTIIERARDLAAAGRDPERWVRKIFGYRITRASLRAIAKLEEEPVVFAVGGHGTGKTFEISAYLLARWYVDGAVEHPVVGLTGGILVLVANKQEQIMATGYKALLEHAEAAKRNGWLLPGYSSASHKSVRWVAHPTRWLIRKETWSREAQVEEHETVGASAGLHSDAPIYAYVEEGHKLDRHMWTTVESWGPQVVFSAMNPYHAAGQARAMIRARRVEVVTYDALKHPNVVQRAQVIPGAITAAQVDRQVSDMAECRRLGDQADARREAQSARAKARPITWPRQDRGDFLYALPPPGVRPGEGPPRDDDIPGTAQGVPAWYRPGPRFTAGIRGAWPSHNPQQVFPDWVWSAAEDLARTLGHPSGPPDRVGVDTAEGGPDRIVARPAWGPTCRQVWQRYQLALREMDGEAAILRAVRCDACQGTGCSGCHDGRSWPLIGEPHEIPKPQPGSRAAGDQEALAAELLARLGSRPTDPPTTWYLDDGGGGYSLRPALDRALTRAGLPSQVHTVAFGSAPPPLADPPRAYANTRAYLFGVVSAVMTLRAVAIHSTRGVEQECRPLRWQVAKGRRDLVYQLQPKDEVRRLIQRSPDDADATVLTEAVVESGLSDHMRQLLTPRFV